MHYFDKDTGVSSAGAGRLFGNERGNAKRIVLLVILLLVLAAAAVLLLYPDLITPPQPEPVKVADTQVKRKVVQLPQQSDPAKPETQAATAKPEAQVAAAKTETKPVATKAETKPTAAKPEAQAATAKPEAQVAAAKTEPKPVATKAETKPAAAKAEAVAVAVKPEPQATTTKPQPKAAIAKPAAAPTGPYAVTAGAFLLKASVDQADAAVRKLGYTPFHAKVTRDIEVIRLREGTYGEAEARSRVAEYAKGLAPEAFVMRTAKGWSVYLGSYVGLDRARVHADRLYAQGVHVSEEKAVVPMALTLVRFGDFPDQASAGQAVAKAKAAGIEAYISKVQ